MKLFQIHFDLGDLYNDENQLAKKVTRFLLWYLTVHQCLFESHPLCSSRKGPWLTRPPDQVVLQQSMHVA